MSHKIDTPDQWNLSLLNIDEATFDTVSYYQPIQAENNAFVSKWKSNTTYLTDPAQLLAALDELEQIDSKYDSSGDAGYYFELRSTQEQDSPLIKGILNKIRDISVKIDNDRQFFLINLSKVNHETQTLFINSPLLSKYKHFLELLFREARYILTDKEERVINITATSSYGNWVQMTSDLISREERQIIDASGNLSLQPITSIINLTTNPVKEIRDKAAQAYNEVLYKYSDVAEAEVNSIIQYKRTIDDMRGFKRPDESRILTDDLDVTVVDSLLDSVSSRYDISREYYKFKAKLFKYEKLAYHERNLDFGDINKEKYSYDRAVSLVKDVFSRLDPEFLSIYEKYLREGRFDVLPRKGKTYGAFCSMGHLKQPGYILLNHTDLLTDVTTIAHEMGHAINHEFTRKSQNAFYFDTPLSTAEVASTFMEDFVLEQLEKNASDEQKLAIMLKRLDEDVSAIMRQVAGYKFELELHEVSAKSGYVSKAKIGELFQKHMKDYMGDSVSLDPGSENWWVYWSHIRMFFYVFSYASGLLISKSLQKKYKENNDFMLEIKEFLSTGTSDSPYNTFLRMGIDIKGNSFWLSGLNQIEQNLNDAKTLAAKLGLL